MSYGPNEAELREQAIENLREREGSRVVTRSFRQQHDYQARIKHVLSPRAIRREMKRLEKKWWRKR